MLSGNSLRQTVRQAAKLVAALLRDARVTAGLRKVMAAYRWVYDSSHPQADYQERDQLRNPMLGNRVGYIYLLSEKLQGLLYGK